MMNSSAAQKNLATFEESGFNEVDSVILSWLVYLHFPKYVLSDSLERIPLTDLFKAEYFEEMFVHVWSEDETLALLSAVAASPRYRNMRLLFYRDELAEKIGKQFAAVTFELTSDLHYIAFRGTDWTLTGWEEDFKMSLREPVPAQTLSADYITSLGNAVSGNLILGGHSKGGNLAVYAAAHCSEEIQARIQTIYSHDGPGFQDFELEEESFKRIQGRIRKTAPQFSVFGMLFEQEVEAKTVTSHETGMMQHNPVSWEVEGNAFRAHKHPARISQHMNKKINNWIDQQSYENRALLIDTIFTILEETGVSSFDEMKDDLSHYLPILLRAIKDLDRSTAFFILDILRQLIFASDDDERQPEAADRGGDDEAAEAESDELQMEAAEPEKTEDKSSEIKLSLDELKKRLGLHRRN